MWFTDFITANLLKSYTYFQTENRCRINHCLNGGSCRNTEVGVRCACTKGFSGNTCECKKQTTVRCIVCVFPMLQYYSFSRTLIYLNNLIRFLIFTVFSIMKLGQIFEIHVYQYKNCSIFIGVYSQALCK